MQKTIKTNKKNWLEGALEQYHKKESFKLKDNAKLGLTEKDLKSGVSLIRAAHLKGGVSWQQIVGILASLGIMGIGVWMIYLAIVDPEPTTKLGLLIAGGTIITLIGSLGALAILGVRFSVSAKLPQGYIFEVKPE